MSYEGRVENGVVVFDGEQPLPDGARVLVEPARPAKPRTLAERLQSVIGIAKGLPSDLAENHDHYLHGHGGHGIAGSPDRRPSLSTGRV